MQKRPKHDPHIHCSQCLRGKGKHACSVFYNTKQPILNQTTMMCNRYETERKEEKTI